MECETNVFTNANINTLEEWKLNKKVLNSSIIRYDWSQTNTCVFLTIYKKGVKSEDFFYFIKKQYVLLTIKLCDEEIYNLEMVIFASILPEQTKINITPMKIEIVLYKEAKGLKWEDIKFKENRHMCGMGDRSALKCFSEKTTEEWNQLVARAQAEEDREESAASNVELFFKKLYSEGDEDTKRAMIKSFQTSNGTVLSTNWKEVQHTNYENVRNIILAKN